MAKRRTKRPTDSASATPRALPIGDDIIDYIDPTDATIAPGLPADEAIESVNAGVDAEMPVAALEAAASPVVETASEPEPALPVFTPPAVVYEEPAWMVDEPEAPAAVAAAVQTSPNVMIVNMAAGKGNSEKLLDEIRIALGEEAISWRWYTTTGPGHAETVARAAAEMSAPVVIAVGGDGTAYEVANGIYGSQSTLAVIPIGRANNFARAIGHDPMNLEASCRAIAEGDTVYIDVGVMEGAKFEGGRVFLSQAGVGFDAWVAMQLNKGPKGVFGTAAASSLYMATSAKFKPFELSISIEEGEHRRTPAWFVTAVNAATLGDGLKTAPNALHTDGKLDVTVFGNVPSMQAMVVLPQMLKGSPVRHPQIQQIRAELVQFDADPPQPLVIDGELLGSTPAAFGILPEVLPVRVPHHEIPAAPFEAPAKRSGITFARR